MAIQKITLGGGCFWCTEAVFSTLKGVTKVTSGYMGGSTKNPTYEDICTGKTGHAEVIDIEYTDISLADILLIFFKTHNPTTLNRQGNDIGTQYRSVVFYHDEAQRQEAVALINKLTDEYVFEHEIVTEISPAGVFYPAEKYHQDYFKLNPTKPYCAAVIQPKMNKFITEFADKLNSNH